MKTTTEYQEAVLADLRAGEKAYPIYVVRVRWSEATRPGCEDRTHRAGAPPLPEGRCWNSTGWDRMEKEDRDTKAMEAMEAELLREWWPKYLVTKKDIREPADVSIVVTLSHRDVWCDSWFSHWTFDVGMSDVEVLDSFQRYVWRVQDSNLSETLKGGMLMGAEDHWRWHGCADGNPQGERTPAPCRCPQCKKNGMVRIDH
jgi:hypothetical protein